MAEILTLILLTGAAGACIPIGGAISSVENFRPNWLEKEFRHFVIAFGGGILLGAVSVVLVPQGLLSMENSMLAIPIMLAGGVVFFVIEKTLGLRRRESPQLMGMVLDYVPEAIALGGLVAVASPLSSLLAFLIGLQNLPEGFNAYRELKKQNHVSTRKTLLIMVLLVPLGPLAGLFGYFFLSGHEAILGGIMLFASGGIIYLIFQDIAPQSRLEKHWAPPIGAVFGFCLALFSAMLVDNP
ncbi:divalent cation transporter [Syntrophotalea acetylenivorans]|uniref:Divalent cation transporter n=1 Tax=Syntrophotalea acetylenivorans TaxID=1842532 RepID=A0A1L3GR55_9BACT|nr:divalent cation transporter [Syntrophotalea acetylenivorans]APG28340.1 divalent cation transporter [Syntrophotalea acetylenivorans]